MIYTTRLKKNMASLLPKGQSWVGLGAKSLDILLLLEVNIIGKR
jgi:hypothetical protein